MLTLTTYRVLFTSINKNVNILNEYLKNIFHNFSPNRITKCNYRDLAWMVKRMIVKGKLKEQSKLTKIYYKYGKRTSDLEKIIITITNECVKIISAAKYKYIKLMCEKLNDPLAAPKPCWKIMNSFLSNKKIPAIPPLLVNGETISNFSQKACPFNRFFASQCTPL